MRRDGLFLACSGSLAGLAAGLENLSPGVPFTLLAMDAAGAACLALVAAAAVAAMGRSIRVWWHKALLILLVSAIAAFLAASLSHARAFHLDVVFYTWAGMVWTTALSLLVAALLVGLLRARGNSGGQGGTRTHTPRGAGT